MIYKEQYDVREEIMNRMKDEMLGPGSEPMCIDREHELISTTPETRYCVGVLFPQEIKMNVEDDSLEALDRNTKEESSEELLNVVEEENIKDEETHNRTVSDMEDNIDEDVSMSTKLLPSSMGITFITNKKLDKLNVDVSFATYRRAKVTDCKIKIDEAVAEDFTVPSNYSSYLEFDKEKRILGLKTQITKKDVSSIREKDDDEDGDFSKYAYRMVDYLKMGYVREPIDKNVEIVFGKTDYYNPLDPIEDTNVKLSALRYELNSEYYSYTVMIINNYKNTDVGKKSIFQPQIKISTEKNPDLVFCDYSKVKSISFSEPEERSNQLLYRNRKNYGTGLGTSVNWNIDDEGKGEIVNDFFPQVDVPQLEFNIQGDVDKNALSMKYLSDLNDISQIEKISVLKGIINSYKEWIDDLKQKRDNLDEEFKPVADEHINNCSFCMDRMSKGVDILENDPVAMQAFSLANRAMYMQRVHIDIQSKHDCVYPDDSEIEDILMSLDYRKTDDKYFWRPFQIAFLLLSINSIVNEKSEERDLVDLIWFPTGGGKTEAYLGLTAFTIFYRKLMHLKESNGTTVIMRYTLRLLAAQQFTRASTLICACEYIRRESIKKNSKYKKYDLGNDEINIGLWIGGDHTPNKIEKAKECYEYLNKSNIKNLKYNKEKYNKFQVLKCPWCGTKLVKDVSPDNKLIGMWGYRIGRDNSFSMTCPQECCAFNYKLPIQIVDEELYKNPPSLLFATVDKFAMMPWYSEIGGFFACNSNNRAPELIIQDELHLISGPLGSMVGLYETVLDYLCSAKGVKPKIIASTATICRAKEQCSALYNRNVFQYPPQGLDASDSFFAKDADLDEKYGRRYVGLLPAGKTKAMMESRVLAGILQIEHEVEAEDEIKDNYWTLTTYFNSLKELGKCSTIVQNDVRDNIRRLANRRLFIKGRRNILRADELTSRVSTTELNQTLEKLEKVRYSSDTSKDKTYPSNLLLATNMISVGIDVDRLNVMVMVGQPKLTSEYIQASSRVGRKYPGIVFTIYDSARSRDRSHYEQFKSYHNAFYKYVEPTGVTPFSEPARQRALHAVILSILRHGKKYESNDEISQFDKKNMMSELNEITSYIVTRVNSINDRLSYSVNDETSILEAEIDGIYDKVDILAKQGKHENLVYGNIMGYKPKDGQVRIMKPFGVDENEPLTFDTLTSMRNVDSAVNVNIVMLKEEEE